MSLRIGLSASGCAGPLLCLALATAGNAAPRRAHASELCTGGEAVRINTIVEGLRSTQGDLVVEIYPDDPKLFLVPKNQVASIHVKLLRSPQSVCLSVPTTGGYGIAVFHDENSDSKFNRNMLGIPSEGFGLSNNPPIRFSMPSFQSVRFVAGEGETSIHVRMRYLTGGSAPK